MACMREYASFFICHHKHDQQYFDRFNVIIYLIVLFDAQFIGLAHQTKKFSKRGLKFFGISFII